MTGRIEFLDIAFDTMTAAQAEAWVAARGADSPFGYVVTPNVDHVVRLAQGSADVHEAYAHAALTICDSRVLSRLAAVSGVQLFPVPGSDLVAALFKRVLRKGDSVCVVGGSAANVAVLRARFPAYTIIHHEPPFGLRYDRAARVAAAQFAVRARARVTLLAVGSPQQELVALEMQRLDDARGTALCIGASIDFLVGAQRRAPALVQSAHLEWAWRLGSSPRRFARRYLVDGPAIVPMVLRWRARQGQRQRHRQKGR